MEKLIYIFGYLFSHSIYFHEGADICCFDGFDVAEVEEEGGAAFRADTGDVIKYGTDLFFAAKFSVIGDGETVCFILE